MKTVAHAVHILLVALIANFAAQAQPVSKDLAGIWSSAGCERRDGADGRKTHLRRHYRFSEKDWSMVQTIYIDENCQQPLFTFFLGGKYQLGKPSAAQPEASEGNFGLARFLLTADDEAALSIVAKCGTGKWVVGVQQDVSKTGCIGIKPLAQCPVDHDIAAIRDGVLYPGLRTPNMCSPAGRPTQLQAVGATKRR